MNTMSRRTFIPKYAKTIPEQAELKFHGEIFDVYQWPQEMFDGSKATFEMLSRADTVKIMALITPEERVKLKNVVNFTTSNQTELVITRQRQPRKDWFYDFPGGRNDNPAEDELAAAKREMREETGLEFRNWKLIEVNQPFAKIDWLVYTFVASGLEKVVEQKLDAGEEIEVLAMSFDKLLQLADDDDSKCLRFKNYKKYATAEELLDAPELFCYTE